MKYKTLFKYLVMSRSMIPLGIYRTERVSFKSLDPSYEPSIEEEDEDQAQILDGNFLKDDNEAINQNDGKKEIKYVISNPDKDVV